MPSAERNIQRQPKTHQRTLQIPLCTLSLANIVVADLERMLPVQVFWGLVNKLLRDFPSPDIEGEGIRRLSLLHGQIPEALLFPSLIVIGATGWLSLHDDLHRTSQLGLRKTQARSEQHQRAERSHDNLKSQGRNGHVRRLEMTRIMLSSLQAEPLGQFMQVARVDAQPAGCLGPVATGGLQGLAHQPTLELLDLRAQPRPALHGRCTGR